MTSGWSTIFLKPLVFEVAFVFERGGVLLVSVFCHVERSRDISYYLLQEILRDWFGSLPAHSALRPPAYVAASQARSIPRSEAGLAIRSE